MMIALLLTAGLAVASGGAGPGLAAPGLAASGLAASGLAALVTEQGAPADTLSAVVEGRVWSGHGGSALAFAVIELRPYGSDEEPRYAVADETGHYRLEQVPAGLLELRAMALDHAPLQVAARVAGGDRVELDLTLEVRPIGLPPLLAEVTVERSAAAPPTILSPERRGEREVRETELRALEATPGMAELGLGDPSFGQPGDPDPGSILYVRGAVSDLKLVLLDGAPVYAPFHLGGLLDAFQPDVLRSARLWVGGAPARFDGGLSYVLDLRTRPGDTERFRSAGAVDLMGARSQVEGPVGPATFLVGGRTVHGAVHEGLTGDPLPYGYGDGLVRLDLPLGRTSGLSGTGFWNRETVSLEALEGLTEPAYWGNTAGSLRWEGPAGQGRLELIAATGNFATRLPMSGLQPRIAEGSSRRSRLQGLYAQRAGPVDLDAGFAFEHLTVELQSRPIAQSIDFASGTSLPSSGDPRPGMAAGEARGTVIGAFADVAWSPLEELDLRAGLRTDAFLSDPTLRLAPRLGAAWRASENTLLSVAVGRFHQYARAHETVLGGDLEGWPVLEDGKSRLASGGVVPSGALLAVVGASHLVVGLENRLRDDLSLGLEAFLKTYDGIPAVDGLRASGADIWLHRSGGLWDAWLGYSIAWVWTERTGEDTDRFAGRHLVSGGLGAQLPRGVEMNLELSYGGGLPFTPIPRTAESAVVPSIDLLAGSRTEVTEEDGHLPFAGAPAGSYMRLDAGVSRSWEGTLQGMEFTLTPYVKLLNALDRRDALFYHFDPERDLRPRSLAAVPLLPILGVEWRL